VGNKAFFNIGMTPVADKLSPAFVRTEDFQLCVQFPQCENVVEGGVGVL
jgi:hypothetical protein